MSQEPIQKLKLEPIKKTSYLAWKIVGAIFFGLVIGIYFILYTQSGAQFFLSNLQKISVGKLEFVGVKGRLIDQISFDEINFEDNKNKIKVNGVRLQWHLPSLLSSQLNIDALEISSLRLASIKNNDKTQIPASLALPLQINIKNLKIGRLFLEELKADKSTTTRLQLNGVQGQYTYNQLQHQLTSSFNSDWGRLHFSTHLESAAPFKLNGKFNYLGIKKENIPEVVLNGNYQGILSQFDIAAQAKSNINFQSASKEEINGAINLQLQVFSPQVISKADIQLQQFNLASLHRDAPNALIELSALIEAEKIPTTNTTSLHSKELPALIGSINLINKTPKSYDQHGLPISKLASKLKWKNETLELDAFQLNLKDGRITGRAKIKNLANQLPLVDAEFLLTDINLNSVDQRLRRTKIQGSVHAENENDHSFQLQTELRDGFASLNATAKVQIDSLGQFSELNLSNFNLFQNKAISQAGIEGSGNISLIGKRKFELKGKLIQFEPSTWIIAPKGKIEGGFQLQGELVPKYEVSLQIEKVQGILGGRKIAGNADLFLKEDNALLVKNLKLDWGGNTLEAKGKLEDNNDELLININATDLETLPLPSQHKISGELKLDAKLKGKLTAPSGLISFDVNQLILNDEYLIGTVGGKVEFKEAGNQLLDAELFINKLLKKSENAKKFNPDNLIAEQIQFNLKGSNSQHEIAGEVNFFRGDKLNLKLNGGIVYSKTNAISWLGNMYQFDFFRKAENKSDVKQEMLLSSIAPISLSSQYVQINNVNLDGALGSIQLDHFHWQPGSLQTKGLFSNFQIMHLLQWTPLKDKVFGNLKLNAQWDLQFNELVKGHFNLQQAEGDLAVNNADVTGKAIPLGIKNIDFKLLFGGLISATGNEGVSIFFDANGSRLGKWSLDGTTELHQENGRWIINQSSPIQARLLASVTELQWLGAQVHPEFALKGKLEIDAKLNGRLGEPTYHALIGGREIELAFASEGLLLPNGTLNAELSDDRFSLKELSFSNKISMAPQHEKIPRKYWIGKEGKLNASGEVNLREQSGDISVNWKQFPLLQRKDRWLITSGQAKISQLNNAWALIGNMKADGAYFQLPKLPPPSLSSDVVVSHGVKPSIDVEQIDASSNEASSKLDMLLDLGPNFVFVGRGIDTQLTGNLRLKSQDNSPIQANGSILTQGGQYDGYGQQLEIERGILNFNGSLNNPSLNIRALRKGLQVEAGVDVTGNVAKPIVRLVSEPNVPDNQKISWLVLGRESDKVSSNDASLLLSAAGAIFGGDGSRNLPKEVISDLGFDEFSIGPPENGGESKLPNQTIAGATSVGSSSNDQVVKIGRRLKPGLVLSFEHGISEASGAVKLSWLLSRRVRLVGKYGAESSVDVKYSFSFN